MSDNMPQNATPGEGMSPAQEKALAALLAGQTITAVAQAANVDRTTVYRWLRDPYKLEFHTALERGRRELRQAVKAHLLALASKAVDCLEGALNHRDEKVALTLLKGLAMLPGHKS